MTASLGPRQLRRTLTAVPLTVVLNTTLEMISVFRLSARLRVTLRSEMRRISVVITRRSMEMSISSMNAGAWQVPPDLTLGSLLVVRVLLVMVVEMTRLQVRLFPVLLGWNPNISRENGRT